MTKISMTIALFLGSLAVACGGSNKPAEDASEQSTSDKASEAAKDAGEATEQATEDAGEKIEEAGDKVQEKTKDEN